MTDSLSRHEFLRRSFAIGAVMTVPGLRRRARQGRSEVPPGVDPKRLKKTLTFSNWPLYIDYDKKHHSHPTLDLFTKQYGVKVKYIEDINQNETFFGKVQAQLRRGQSIGRDLIVMTDNSRFPALLVQQKWVEKIDKSVIPNIKNLLPALQHPGWDPNRDYSLPWQSGMTGIGYNWQRTKPITTVDQLLFDKKLKGKVTLLDSIGDTLPVIVLSNGDDPTKIDDAAFNRGAEEDREGEEGGSDPQVHRQRLHRDVPDRRRVRRARLVGRHAPDPRLDAEGELARSPVWRDDLDRQHADPDRRRRVHGVRLHELLLRAEDRGAGRGCDRLRLPGRWRGQGAASRSTRRPRRTR